MSLLPLIIVIYFIIYIPSVTLIIILENKSTASTIAWIFVVSFMPIIGLILYLYLGKRYSYAKFRFISKKKRKVIKKLLRKQKELLKNKARGYDRISEALKLSTNLGFPFSKNNEIKLLIDGKEAFKDILKEIKNAKNHIHIEMHILKFNSDIGKKIKKILISKAKAGVKIRIIYDGLISKITYKDKKELLDAGVSIKALFPPRIALKEGSINNRTHRKIIVIDGKIAYTGGINIGDEYIYGKKSLGKWHDVLIKIKGPAVYSIQGIFLSTYIFLTKEKIKEKDLFPKTDKGKSLCSIVASGPDFKEPNIYYSYFNIINTSKKYLWIMTPYFIPNRAMITSLCIASLRGVDVRILLPHKADSPFVWHASRTNFKKLLKAGVRIYYYNGFCHGKIIASDSIVSIGSCNFDIRSFFQDFELNAIIYKDKALEKKIRNMFIKDFKNSEEIILNKFLRRPLKIRIKESLSRLFYPLL